MANAAVRAATYAECDVGLFHHDMFVAGSDVGSGGRLCNVRRIDQQGVFGGVSLTAWVSSEGVQHRLAKAIVLILARFVVQPNPNMSS